MLSCMHSDSASTHILHQRIARPVELEGQDHVHGCVWSGLACSTGSCGWWVVGVSSWSTTELVLVLQVCRLGRVHVPHHPHTCSMFDMHTSYDASGWSGCHPGPRASLYVVSILGVQVSGDEHGGRNKYGRIHIVGSGGCWQSLQRSGPGYEGENDGPKHVLPQGKGCDGKAVLNEVLDMFVIVLHCAGSAVCQWCTHCI